MIIKNLLVLVLFASNILASTVKERAKPESKKEYLEKCKQKNVVNRCANMSNQCNEPMRSRPFWCRDGDFYDNCIKDGKKACEEDYYKAHPEIPAWKRLLGL